MKSIESRQNPVVKRFRHAVREHANEIVIEGPKQVADALRAGWKPLALAVRRGVETPVAFPQAVSLSADAFDSLTDTRNSQGVIALFPRPTASAQAILENRSSVVVALDGVQDPGNVGTMVRLAAAFEAAGILLLPGCADPFSPKAIRASAGAILQVPIAAAVAADLLACGVELYAADAEGTAAPPPAREGVLLFGSEGTGVSMELSVRATRIAVPISPRVESLNVAASAAILLSRSFELRRAAAP